MYTPNLTPEALATGDFNGDGRPDIVTGSAPNSPNPGGVYVMLNDGAGGFASPTFYAAGQYQQDVAVADFNNDGKLDIAVPNFFSNTVSVLPGTGTGSFGQAINSPTGGNGPSFISPIDVNHDGKLDLAVSNDASSGNLNIAILLGDGAGNFTVSTILASVAFMRAADFNNDGNPDIVGVTDQLRYYRGNSDGTFTLQPDVNTGLPVTSFTIADLNRDNKPDIVAVSGSNAMSVVLNNGNGTFSAPVIYQISVIRVGSFVVTGDVNGDGLVDIALTNNDTDGRVHVLLGNGAGSFTLVDSYSTTVQRPERIVLADFNGSGRLSIAAINFVPNDSHIIVMLRTCLAPTPRYDFDGDGRADISVYRPSSGIWYALRSSDNSFTAQGWGTSTDRIVSADYDGDLKTDLAVYRPQTGTWYILRSTNNTFISQAFGLSSDTPVPADYDGDGRADFAVYRAGIWYILRSSDNQLVTQSFGASTDKPLAADYDGDGKADFGVYRPQSGVWYVKRSTTVTLLIQPFGTMTDQPVVGDFDGDGTADLAVYRPQTGTWYALRSSNNSLLAQSWGVSTDVPAPADYDGDGKTDVAVYRPSSGMWFIQRSTDNLMAAQPFGVSTDIAVPAASLP